MSHVTGEGACGKSKVKAIIPWKGIMVLLPLYGQISLLSSPDGGGKENKGIHSKNDDSR